VSQAQQTLFVFLTGLELDTSRLNIGLDLGVLSPTLFTILVIMALVSTAMTAPLATWLARRERSASVPSTSDFGGGPAAS